MRDESLTYLKALIATPSPSGFEQPVANLYRDYVSQFADKLTTDVMGNVSAVINPDAGMRIMYVGHMDEIGFIVHYIDEEGFLYFDTIGGTDVATEIGQRVWVHGHERVAGVVGRKAIQTFKLADGSQTPTLKDLWIDIGAASRKDAEAAVKVGSPVSLQAEFTRLLGDQAVDRAFDKKAGLFIGSEIVRRLKEDGGLHPDVGLYVLGTVQEEIGSRGAQTAAFNLAPHQGKLDLGKGPGISQEPSTNPVVFELLKTAADRERIPYQLQAYGDKIPTDARLLQTNCGGVATGLLSVPLRYMHTPSEVLCLGDITATIDLVCAFCSSVRPDTDFTPW
ncbi:M42 family peptidase [Mesorhizobium loti]|uniref:M42 family peptidase n=1 Tax=Rhizobium loti TaxID=381 RepID=UPI00041F1344|nr:M42 family peptidase [Mesorhizobium loti]